MKILKCLKCGALVESLIDCTCKNCGVQCCGETMVELKANTTDAAAEKHVPTYVKNGNMIEVSVNHVMENDHYIMWIAIVTKNSQTKVMLKPGDEAKAVFHYVKGSTIYAYCNKHGLWSTKVK